MHYITSNDNAKIAVYDINTQSPKVIFLIHGWPLSHRMFEYQLPSLLANGYRIIMIDLRGFGKSDFTYYGYNIDQFATDLSYVIRALKLDNFTLLGFSVGGAIATRYMNIYKGIGVNKLCLVSAAVPSYSKTLTNPYGQNIEDTDNLIKLGYNDRTALNEYFGNLFFYNKSSKSFINYIQNISDFSSSIGQIQTLISLRNENCFNDLKHINVKTGIFHGKEDKICSFEMAKIVKANIYNSKLFPFENAGHGVFYDSKDLFNDTLIQFLNEI